MNSIRKVERLHTRQVYFYVWWVIICVINVVMLAICHLTVCSPGECALVNLLIAVLLRNEIVTTQLHRWAVTSLSQGHKANYHVNIMVHSIGGAHACSAIFTLGWLCISCWQDIWGQGSGISSVLDFLNLLTLSTVAVMAIPTIRVSHHDVFEKTHRSGGWLSIGLSFTHLFLDHDRNLGWPPNMFMDLLKNPSLVMLLTVTMIVIMPWIALRSHRVIDIEVFSRAVVKLTLPGRGGPGTFARISLDAIEWHAFSVALYDPTAQGADEKFSLLIASAGDWTQSLVEMSNSGKSLARVWVRHIKPLGFMYSIHAYRRSVVVATGAGIAPVLRFITSNFDNIFVIWIVSDPAVSFGSVAEIVFRHPHVSIHDTAIWVRPNAAHLAIDATSDFDAEAVFCVSNPSLTHNVVSRCLAVGIPAFGECSLLGTSRRCLCRRACAPCFVRRSWTLRIAAGLASADEICGSVEGQSAGSMAQSWMLSITRDRP